MRSRHRQVRQLDRLTRWHTDGNMGVLARGRYAFAWRAFAAFRAIAFRFAGDSAFALAAPPIRPSATAAGFFPSSAGTDSSVSPVAILMTWTALEITSAGRF